VAEKILNSVLDEILSGIFAVSKKVGLKEKFYITIVGGVFHNKFLLYKLITELRKKIKSVKIIIISEQEVGAARLAKRLLNKKIVLFLYKVDWPS